VTLYLTEKLSKLRSFDKAIVQTSELSFPVVFHTQNCAVHSGNPPVSSVFLPTPTQSSYYTSILSMWGLRSRHLMQDPQLATKWRLRKTCV